MGEHDLVIRNGTVVDGTGNDRFVGDVAVSNGVVTAVGKIEGVGRRELDAEGHLVAPGFVDIHTHYDGQATWDTQLAPSSWHGVTTVVMGNCGVGFAPVKPGNRERLIQLMEGVEDIPGTALHEGLSWEWSSFPEYLDDLDRKPRDIDLGAQLPHGALRLHVMGERGADSAARHTRRHRGDGRARQRSRGGRRARVHHQPHVEPQVEPRRTDADPARRSR